MVIYLITNLLNNKKYVGQTSRDFKQRIKEHTKDNLTEIDRDIKIYGIENFKTEIIEECKTIEEMNKREKYWISELKCRRPLGYNVMPGGNNGHQLKMKYHKRKIMVIESEQIKELKQEIDNLKNTLMMMQSQLIESQKETNLLQKELLQSKMKLLEIEVSSQKISVLKAQNEELKEELEKLKKRSLIERILNK